MDHATPQTNGISKLTPGQLAIITKLAELHAELACCLREVKRTHLELDPKGVNIQDDR